MARHCYTAATEIAARVETPLLNGFTPRQRVDFATVVARNVDTPEERALWNGLSSGERQTLLAAADLVHLGQRLEALPREDAAVIGMAAAAAVLEEVGER